MREYVLLFIDECGDARRCCGDNFLEQVHKFPSYEEGDISMEMAHEAWVNAVEERAYDLFNADREETYHVFLEETGRSVFRVMRRAGLIEW